MAQLTILICDDQHLFTEALAAVLTHRGHIVEGIAASPEEAVDFVAQQPVDVVLMDLRFPGGLSLDAIKAIAHGRSKPDVVVLTGCLDPSLCEQALEAGARACVEKQVPLSLIVSVLEEPSVRHRVTASPPTRGSTVDWTEADLAEFLTPREWEVLSGLATGENTAAIADRLSVSHATARTHVQNLLSKLGVHSRVEAVLFAVEHDLLDVGESVPAGL